MKALRDEHDKVKGQNGDSEAALKALRDEHDKVKGAHSQAEDALKRALADIASKDAALAGLQV